MFCKNLKASEPERERESNDIYIYIYDASFTYLRMMKTCAHVHSHSQLRAHPHTYPSLILTLATILIPHCIDDTIAQVPEDTAATKLMVVLSGELFDIVTFGLTVTSSSSHGTLFTTLCYIILSCRVGVGHGNDNHGCGEFCTTRLGRGSKVKIRAGDG